MKCPAGAVDWWCIALCVVRRSTARGFFLMTSSMCGRGMAMPVVWLFLYFTALWCPGDVSYGLGVATAGTAAEMVCPGGELAFVLQMLVESTAVADRVHWCAVSRVAGTRNRSTIHIPKQPTPIIVYSPPPTSISSVGDVPVIRPLGGREGGQNETGPKLCRLGEGRGFKPGACAVLILPFLHEGRKHSWSLRVYGATES